MMNPNSILSRESGTPIPPMRRQQAARGDFRLPEPPPAAEDRRNAGVDARKDRMARLADSPRKELGREPAGKPAENARRAPADDPRGGGRSQDVRQDGAARANRASRGEGPERRSARADQVSGRDGQKQVADASTETAATKEDKTPAGQPMAAEAAALELLASLEAEAAAAVATGPEKGEAPPAAATPGALELPLPGPAPEPAGSPQPLMNALPMPPPPPSPQETPGAPGDEPEADAFLAGGDGKGARLAPPPALPGADGPQGLVGQPPSPEDGAQPAPASDQVEAPPKPATEAAQAPGRTPAEQKAETSQGQPQPAAIRFEPLPPGLVALPEQARALQAQIGETERASGPLPHGNRPAEPPPTSMSALPIEIGFRALAGSKRFDIRLDPPELGRVDVSLSFEKEGEVTAKLTVDRVETLHLLQRDARTLERAFDQAGLRMSDAGVQISLSDRNAGQGGGFQAEQERSRSSGGLREEAAALAPPPEAVPLRRLRIGGVDLNI
jgi:flagellar hook-length control protein FliK